MKTSAWTWITVLVAMLIAGATQAATIVGTPDNSAGVYLFSAGEDSYWCGNGTAAGEPTDDIVSAALGYDLLTYMGDTASEVVSFTTGSMESNDDGPRDNTIAEVTEGLTEVDDFGVIANGSDDSANFDSGKGGQVTLKLDAPFVIAADGVTATGTLGPDGAGNAAAAAAALDGFEIFIFEDAELSGMKITLTSRDNTYVISIADRQVDPNTQQGADDTLIAIDLDSLSGWDGTYISQIKVQDNNSQMNGGDCNEWYGDTSMELDAVAVRHSAIVEVGSIGDYVWDDADEDGVQDAGELGIDNITVELYEVGTPTPIATTNTDNTGYYLFDGLVADDYYVKFIKPAGRLFSPQFAGSDTAKDSNADVTTGQSGTITLLAGENNTTVDAGMYTDPVLVTLTHFGAIERDGEVVVQWSTGEEFGTIGFIVERLSADTWVSVNDQLIRGSLFSTVGRDYEYVDAGAVPGATYIYRLVEIENTGNHLVYGPFTIDVPVAETTLAGESDPLLSAPAETALSPPAITDMKAVNGNIVLRWASEDGRTYSIERIAELGGTPVTIATGVPATPPENVVILVDGADAGFFRIQVED